MRNRERNVVMSYTFALKEELLQEMRLYDSSLTSGSPECRGRDLTHFCTWQVQGSP